MTGGTPDARDTDTEGGARSESETGGWAFFPLPCLWRTYVS